MKNVLLIATGGTIASKNSSLGLVPMTRPEEILRAVPDVSKICKITTVQLINLDSTNMNWRHWLMIAGCIYKNYYKFDGFVITHGTDTMAYTAAALSYLIQGSAKPIILTGAQKSIHLRDTDARTNLFNAFLCATNSHIHGVYIVFNNRVILGTRARKTRTKSYNAFESIDHPEIAVIRDERIIFFAKEDTFRLKPLFYSALNPKIFVLRLFPGICPTVLNELCPHYDGIIIESFGVGGLPDDSQHHFAHAIENWINAGKTIVMATQVPLEGSDMTVYQVGRKIKEQYGLMETYTMTTEAVLTKLMWILAQTRDTKTINHLFYTPIHRDII